MPRFTSPIIQNIKPPINATHVRKYVCKNVIIRGWKLTVKPRTAKANPVSPNLNGQIFAEIPLSKCSLREAIYAIGFVINAIGLLWIISRFILGRR